MKLMDYGTEAQRDWFQQILRWSRKKITFEDNLDCVFIDTSLLTTETAIEHPLGRTPRFVMEVAKFPNGTAGITWGKAPTNTQLFLKRSSAGNCTLMIM